MSVGALQLLIIDEAHLLAATHRGPRLELLIARALRAGVRVILLSSQFPDTEVLATWLDGRSIESDWGPTWLHRQVYSRSADGTHGILTDETGCTVAVLSLAPRRADGRCPPERREEAAALAELSHRDGLVVVFSDQRRYMDKLSEAVRKRLGQLPSPADPALAGRIEPLKSTYPAHWDLLRAGVGVHHAQVPPAVRLVVERCARKGLLRCVVCTPTLLEGVDFPTKTVICAYPPETNGRPQVGRAAQPRRPGGEGRTVHLRVPHRDGRAPGPSGEVDARIPGRAAAHDIGPAPGPRPLRVPPRTTSRTRTPTRRSPRWTR